MKSRTVVFRVESRALRCGLAAAATIVLFGIGVFMNASTAQDSPAKPSQKLLRHIVLYQFKPEISAEQVQEVVDAFSALPRKIDTIVGYEHGTNISEENKSAGLTHCFIVSFRDVAGREAYLKHPAHDAYVKVVKDRREKVIVFDYWSE